MGDTSKRVWIWVGIAVAVVVVAGGVWMLLGANATIPSVIGMTGADAVRTLQADGFTLGSTEETVSTLAAGTVVSQWPKGGITTKKGARVDLLIAKAEELVSVPDVMSKDASAAADALTAAGLAPVPYSDYNPTTAAGTVFGQVPNAGQQVAPGTQVALGISLGPAPAAATVPKVTGMTSAEASSALQKAGFEVSASDGYSDTVAAGKVISQLPAAGAKALPGSTVGIAVSRGKATTVVKVPNVAGKTESDAVAALQKAGLGSKTYVTFSNTVPKGSVIGQMPAAGSGVAPGTVIGLAISQGKAPSSGVKVPDVVGATSAEATSAIAAAGLQATVYEQPSDTVNEGLVIQQSPIGGSLVPPNSHVLIAVSIGPANKLTPK